jgi:hypothetical protein
MAWRNRAFLALWLLCWRRLPKQVEKLLEKRQVFFTIDEHTAQSVINLLPLANVNQFKSLS